MAGFVDALRPKKFTGVPFKRWQVKVTLWFTVMNVFCVSTGKPEGDLTADQKKAYSEANTIFLGAAIGVLVDRLQDVYIYHTIAKDMWDALIADYGGSDDGAELDFATTLKHKRTNISVSDLIASLDVEEKAREKDERSKVNEGNTIANMVHQPQQSHGSSGKNKGKNNKPKQTTTFKKKNKEKGACFVCGSNEHWAKKCPERKGRKPPQQKSVNMVTSAGENSGSPGIPPS
ncbi:hypothetical protein QOZ80_5BG0420890 [Eleusine coracana subsp. coracana]|nr:hypothetical protein QOZ80_5BG0420890 [Eleusine coracana subsp. coracana]